MSITKHASSIFFRELISFTYYVLNSFRKYVWHLAGGVSPDTLQYVTLNITTDAYCSDLYLNPPRNFTFTVDMICASDNVGTTERDSCQVFLTITIAIVACSFKALFCWLHAKRNPLMRSNQILKRLFMIVSSCVPNGLQMTRHN